MNTIELNDILARFNIDSETEAYGNGHINDTYRTSDNEYILQKINTNVFNNPEKMMENIDNVTAFLKEKIIAEGGNPDRETLTVIRTVDGERLIMDKGCAYRVYRFVQNAFSPEQGTKEEMYEAGKCFGQFQSRLDDYPAATLFETIKDFHNTPKRVEAFEAAVSADIAGRAASVTDEIEFVRSCARFASVVTDGIADGSIPLRVTHNDTKINNLLFDDKTRKGICVIDLDTVMPGSALYDFGDALRIGASTAAEDETNLEIVKFDKEIFRMFAKGYFEEMKDKLTQREIELLPFSAKLLTFECGMRFLTDHLNGDTYFKIHRENHNLDRARNQFKLVREIEALEDELLGMIKEM